MKRIIYKIGGSHIGHMDTTMYHYWISYNNGAYFYPVHCSHEHFAMHMLNVWDMAGYKVEYIEHGILATEKD